jgi:hypothetical protein
VNITASAQAPNHRSVSVPIMLVPSGFVIPFLLSFDDDALGLKRASGDPKIHQVMSEGYIHYKLGRA